MNLLRNYYKNISHNFAGTQAERVRVDTYTIGNGIINAAIVRHIEYIVVEQYC